MTLHDAIVQVLKLSNSAMTATQIAEVLNTNSWYTKKDSSLIKSSQISARVKNYPHLFVKSNTLILLKSATGISIKAPLPLLKKQQISQIAGNSELLVKVLMNAKNCKTISTCEDNIPDQPGLYCIRIANPKAFSEPFSKVLEDRKHNIVYIGLASQSLKKRFLGQELRAKGHGTFFRSLGAVLGFTPEPGSLIGKSNQDNYKFHPSIEKEIIKWIEANLVINWVVVSDNLKGIENDLIKEHLPLLNIAGNPGALALVQELRNQCKRIARGN